MLSLEANPPIVSSPIESLEEFGGPWWVGHTKSRFEKAFAWDLIARNVGYFLPMSQRTTFSSGRKRRSLMPLFPSYVFFCGDEETRYQALRTNRLCRVLPVPEQSELVGELQQIYRVLRSGGPLELYPEPPVGSVCRVTAGPFKGLEGVVLSHAKPTRLILEVGILGQGASLDIDAELLELAEVHAPPQGAPRHGMPWEPMPALVPTWPSENRGRLMAG